MADQDYQPGSVADFDRLYRSSYRRVLYTVYGVLGDRAAAEDCVQDAFVRAFKAWSRWTPDAPAEAWLHRIALNVALSYRKRSRFQEVGELVRRLGRPEPEPDPAEVAERSDLFDALRRLSPEQAALIVLRHHHGYTNREIAYALKAPESTIASRLAKAKETLRKQLIGRALAEGRPSRPLPVVSGGDSRVLVIDGQDALNAQ